MDSEAASKTHARVRTILVHVDEFELFCLGAVGDSRSHEEKSTILFSKYGPLNLGAGIRWI
jgi:hypothetical protein